MNAREKDQSSEIDLFVWREWHEIEGQRAALQKRIKGQPKQSHKRVALQTRLQELTTELLKLETKQ